MNDQQPIHIDFMDEDMKRLWDRIPARGLSARGFMLFGGTALAMYLNHRSSTDFDFFTATSSVRPDEIRQMFYNEKGFQIVGQEGAVDMKWSGGDRTVLMNFLNVDYYFGLSPEFPPHTASNGIPVARPTDILVGKLAALKQRGELRDFRDIAAAANHLPEELDYAIERYVSLEQRLDDRRELTKTLLRYPYEVEFKLTNKELETIDRLARQLDAPSRSSKDPKAQQDSGFDR